MLQLVLDKVAKADLSLTKAWNTLQTLKEPIPDKFDEWRTKFECLCKCLDLTDEKHLPVLLSKISSVQCSKVEDLGEEERMSYNKVIQKLNSKDAKKAHHHTAHTDSKDKNRSHCHSPEQPRCQHVGRHPFRATHEAYCKERPLPVPKSPPAEDKMFPMLAP